MKIAGATVAILLPLPIIAPNLQTFAMSLFVLGSALGTLDVAMNAHGLIVEQAIKKATMSSFHAIYSIAGLLAAGLAAVLIDNVSEFTRVLLTSITCIGVLLYAASRLLPAQIDKGHSEASFSLPTRATVGIGLLCLIALMIEGSILEWSGIHLRENLKASGIITSINVAAYSGGMALSRLLGDGMRQKFGSTLLVRSSAIATTFFMVLALMVSNSKFAVCAFALSGFALGPIAPILYVSGGRADRISPSRGISSVTTFGFLGIVLGPPFIGMLAELTGLQIALGTVALLSIIIALFANLTKVADINL